MKFSSTLIEGILIRRYKRFLADVRLNDGSQVTCHTANTGAMTGCAEPGSRVWLSDSKNEKRKYPLSWELVETASGVLIGINTQLSNHLVQEAIELGTIAELQNYPTLRTEVSYGSEKSRIDLLLQDGEKLCYVEVKNVTYVEQGTAYFPDAVSKRGSKHLRELIEVVGEGQRGVILFCVQRGDVEQVRPADRVDELYGKTLREALAKGVEALAYQARVTPQGVELIKPLPVTLD